MLPTVIVGNKMDLERKLPFEEIEATVCLDWECGYAECSALTGVGVEAVFRELMTQAKAMAKSEECSTNPAPSIAAKQSASQLKRHSLVKRLFSREKTKEYAPEDQQPQQTDSCKLS